MVKPSTFHVGDCEFEPRPEYTMKFFTPKHLKPFFHVRNHKGPESQWRIEASGYTNLTLGQFNEPAKKMIREGVKSLVKEQMIRGFEKFYEEVVEF